MPHVFLKPLDSEISAPIEIPQGHTTIGRGPFLGCTERKVSRQHAIIEVTDNGKVFLKSIHVNPCFFYPSPGSIKFIKKGVSIELKNGDRFSLLPSECSYRVIVTDEPNPENVLKTQISLKPLDAALSAIVVPVGKTTIGRGSFLGCKDKKISRRHAVLEVTKKGEIFITPIHKNPCFYYHLSAFYQRRILKKGVRQKLVNGDSFSLLPSTHVFEVDIGDQFNNQQPLDENDQCLENRLEVKYQIRRIKSSIKKLRMWK